GKDVEPEDRDQVDRDVDGEPLVVRRERERQERDQRGGRECGHESHTRRTCLRPKRPVGFTSSTSSKTANAIGSRSSDVAKPTYWPIRFRKTPSARPPVTAPAGLSSPPSTAAANA